MRNKAFHAAANQHRKGRPEVLMKAHLNTVIFPTSSVHQKLRENVFSMSLLKTVKKSYDLNVLITKNS